MRTAFGLTFVLAWVRGSEWEGAFDAVRGAWRLRWGFLDEMLPVPWVHCDERVLYHLIRRAGETGTPVEVVAGSAPGWEDPSGRGRRASS